MEVSKQGMLCCKFNSAHKIVGLEFMFDVMAFMLQLKQAAGTDTFSVVPNTVQTCQRSFDSPMVMTLAERPYTILQANKLWEEMTGYKAEEVVGKASCRVLQGLETNRQDVAGLMSAVRFKRPASTMIMNYTKAGKRFRNYVTVYPLSTDSKITHYVALTSHVEKVDGVDDSTNGKSKSILLPSNPATTSSIIPGAGSLSSSPSRGDNSNQGQLIQTTEAVTTATTPQCPPSQRLPPMHTAAVSGRQGGQGLSITGIANGLPSLGNSAIQSPQVSGSCAQPQAPPPPTGGEFFKPTSLIAKTGNGAVATTLAAPRVEHALPPVPPMATDVDFTASATVVTVPQQLVGNKRPLESVDEGTNTESHQAIQLTPSS